MPTHYWRGVALPNGFPMPMPPHVETDGPEEGDREVKLGAAQQFTHWADTLIWKVARVFYLDECACVSIRIPTYNWISGSV